MRSYGTVVMFAAGVGITHQISYVRDLVAGSTSRIVACRKLVLIWMVQEHGKSNTLDLPLADSLSIEHLEWTRPWISTILSMPRHHVVLKIRIFVTRSKWKRFYSETAVVQISLGKPNVETLVGLEMHGQVGAVGVSVCGTGSLCDEVRTAVRRRQLEWNVDLMEPSFSW
jgi:hypothetical protein